jgi:hypothetical protein
MKNGERTCLATVERWPEIDEPAEPTDGVVEPLANGQSFSGRKLRLVAAGRADAAPAGSVEKPVAGTLETKFTWMARVAEQAAGLIGVECAEARELGQQLLTDLGAYRFAEIRPLLTAHYRAQLARARRRKGAPQRLGVAVAEAVPTQLRLAEVFCAQHGVAPERCQHEIFHRTLYPWARLVAPLLNFLNPKHFVPDYEFVQGTARLRSREKLTDEIAYFGGHPGNEGFLRQVLRLRISVRRMERLVEATFNGAPD